MTLPQQIARQFREVYLEGTWIATNFKTQLSDVTWQQANMKLDDLNTIAMLAFHVNYYVAGVLNVLEGGGLDIRDKYSYDMAAIESEEDWAKLLSQMWQDGEQFASLIEQLPEARMNETFVHEKYGNYSRNLLGIIEHCYYHLGQVVMLKKLISKQD